MYRGQSLLFWYSVYVGPTYLIAGTAIAYRFDPAFDPALDPGPDPALDPALDPGIDPAFDPALNIFNLADKIHGARTPPTLRGSPSRGVRTPAGRPSPKPR